MGIVNWVVTKFQKKKKKIEAFFKAIRDRRNQDWLFEQNMDEMFSTGRLIVFVLPDKEFVTGGILSIFNIAKTSRKFEDRHGSKVVMATFPSFYTYTQNHFFRNRENIYRLEQILNNTARLGGMTLHIPEYLAGKFYDSLTEVQRKRLAKIPQLHINILNQNIDIMPEVEKWVNLYKLTDKITQTVAHHKYGTQEICNKYGIPLTVIPAFLDMSEYHPTEFSQKEKLIAYSNDDHPRKIDVLAMLKEKLPDYKTVEINNLSFDAYMQLITRARFTITFGEGFDYYLYQPLQVGSMGIAVYNERFFPTVKYRELNNVFVSYEELIAQFADKVRYYEQNQEAYREDAKKCEEMMNNLYDDKDYCRRIANFYDGNYDFVAK